MPQFVRVAEAARNIGIHEVYVYQAAKQGLIPSRKNERNRIEVELATAEQHFLAQQRAKRAQDNLHARILPMLERLEKAAQRHFGRYAPTSDRIIEAAMDIIIADMEGRVSVREQEPA